MINCSDLASRCVVSANEQMFCSLIWAVKYIVLPLSAITIIIYVYQRYKCLLRNPDETRKEKKK
jgi:hypothetical protein